MSDIGYAGYFYHANSGLELTVNRAYDPVHSRWLNRDPIAEAGGLNLYAYASLDPLTNIDPMGLDDYSKDCVGRYASCGVTQTQATPGF